MDQHNRMHHRAHKYWKASSQDTEAGKLLERAFARALSASQKGRATLFDSWLMPLPWLLIEEFFDVNGPLLLRPGVADVALIRKCDADAMQELAESLKGDSPWVSPMHPDFGDLRKYNGLSLHDERLLAWSHQGDEVRMEFSGFYGASKMPENGLLLIFKSAKTKVIFKGRQATIAQERAWSRPEACSGTVKNKGLFVRTIKRLGTEARGLTFSELPWIHINQFSKPSDEKAEIRIRFGSNDVLELAVSGDSVKSVIGRDAIKSFYESEALSRSIANTGVKPAAPKRSL